MYSQRPRGAAGTTYRAACGYNLWGEGAGDRGGWRRAFGVQPAATGRIPTRGYYPAGGRGYYPGRSALPSGDRPVSWGLARGIRRTASGHGAGVVGLAPGDRRTASGHGGPRVRPGGGPRVLPVGDGDGETGGWWGLARGVGWAPPAATGGRGYDLSGGLGLQPMGRGGGGSWRLARGIRCTASGHGGPRVRPMAATGRIPTRGYYLSGGRGYRKGRLAAPLLGFAVRERVSSCGRQPHRLRRGRGR